MCDSIPFILSTDEVHGATHSDEDGTSQVTEGHKGVLHAGQEVEVTAGEMSDEPPPVPSSASTCTFHVLALFKQLLVTNQLTQPILVTGQERSSTDSLSTISLCGVWEKGNVHLHVRAVHWAWNQPCLILREDETMHA